MPDIDLIPVPLYTAEQAYHHLIDNLPIQGLIDRILSVNNQVDIDANILRGSIGTQGTLANRLSQSLNPDGSLKTAAVDNALHNIASHLDGSILVDGVPISYVRMLATERSKLNAVASGATNLKILIDVNNLPLSNIPSSLCVLSNSEVEFFQDILHIKPSDSITWRVDTTGSILAETTFPAAARHQHFYDYTPAFQNPSSPDYKSYKVTSVGTPYTEQSLRVYINGVRLSQSAFVYYPKNFASTVSWQSLKYTEGTATNGVVTDGTFTLSSAITNSDVIRIDFDALYV